MNKKDFFLLGYINKIHGNKGNMIFYLDVDDTKKYENISSVFIEINKELIPFFIDNIKIKQNNKAIVKLQDIDSSEKAKEFLHSKLYLPIKLLPQLKGNKFYYHEIIGFKVIDQKYDFIGNIENILEYTHQKILQINFNNKEILIPITDEIIVKVDRKNKQLNIKAPEGLIDIYL